MYSVNACPCARGTELLCLPCWRPVPQDLDFLLLKNLHTLIHLFARLLPRKKFLFHIVVIAMTTNDTRRFLLEEALHKAKDAVFFDNHQHYEDAIIKYGNSCALLGQVMRTHLEDDDKRKIEAIVSVSVCIDSVLGR